VIAVGSGIIFNMKLLISMVSVASVLTGLVLLIVVLRYIAIVNGLNFFLADDPLIYLVKSHAWIKYSLIIFGVLFIIHGGFLCRCALDTERHWVKSHLRLVICVPLFFPVLGLFFLRTTKTEPHKPTNAR
jgi:hypothetical protein